MMIILLVLSMINPITTDTTIATTSSVANVTSTYSNSLTYSSGTYVRPNSTTGYSYYYQAIQLYTYTRGQYNFRSSSSIDTYGCFYNGYFDPSSPGTNLVVCDDDSAGDQQFSINAALDNGLVYYLVVTTFKPSTIGGYVVLATGPATVYMTSSTPSTTSSSQIVSTYSGTLDRNSGTFARAFSVGSSNYYYQAFRLTISKSSYYSLTSISSMDTYGCLYSYSFDSSNPTDNLDICNDDGGTALQFLISEFLETDITYILVVTTSRPSILGDFRVQAKGPAFVDMTSISPSNGTWNVLEIIALSIACSIAILIIVAICAWRRKRRTLERRRLLSSNRNGNGNAFNATPYNLPRTFVEEAPPAYETVVKPPAPADEQIRV